MADKVSDQGKPPIEAAKLVAILKDIQAKKDKASEYAGHVGKATAQACDQHGLEKNALTVVRRMYGMEEAKRQSFLNGIVEYAFKAGYFDQLDAFDSVVDTLKAIIARIEGEEGGDKPPMGDNIRKLKTGASVN